MAPLNIKQPENTLQSIDDTLKRIEDILHRLEQTQSVPENKIQSQQTGIEMDLLEKNIISRIQKNLEQSLRP